ncbi:MAG: hypothetical protein ACR2JR_14830 [Rubrobacteraceae bacterium]
MVGGPAKRNFLVEYDCGIRGLWACTWAESGARIKREHPESKVIHDAPPRMARETRARIKKTSTFDIDAPTVWLSIPDEERP